MNPIDYMAQFPHMGPGATREAPRYAVFDRGVLLPCRVKVDALAYTNTGLALFLYDPEQLRLNTLLKAVLAGADLETLRDVKHPVTDLATPEIETVVIARIVNNDPLVRLAGLMGVTIYGAVPASAKGSHMGFPLFRYIKIRSANPNYEAYSAFVSDGSVGDALSLIRESNQRRIDEDPGEFFEPSED